MSTYYNYYIFKVNDGKLLDYTLRNSGNNRVVPIGAYSRSFAPANGDMDEIFRFIYNDKEEKMKKDFYKIVCSNCNEEDYKDIMSYETITYAKYSDFKRLATSGIREGFYPVNVVNIFNEIKSDYFTLEDFKYEEISPYYYSTLPEEEKRQYVYFTFLDETSVGYKVDKMCTVADALINDDNENDFIVIQRVM